MIIQPYAGGAGGGSIKVKSEAFFEEVQTSTGQSVFRFRLEPYSHLKDNDLLHILLYIGRDNISNVGVWIGTMVPLISGAVIPMGKDSSGRPVVCIVENVPIYNADFHFYCLSNGVYRDWTIANGEPVSLVVNKLEVG